MAFKLASSLLARSLCLLLLLPPLPPPPPRADDVSQLATSAIVLAFAFFALYRVCFPRKHKTASSPAAASAGGASPQLALDETPLALSELGSAVRKLTEYQQEDQLLDAGAFLLDCRGTLAYAF